MSSGSKSSVISHLKGLLDERDTRIRDLEQERDDLRRSRHKWKRKFARRNRFGDFLFQEAVEEHKATRAKYDTLRAQLSACQARWEALKIWIYERRSHVRDTVCDLSDTSDELSRLEAETPDEKPNDGLPRRGPEMALLRIYAFLQRLEERTDREHDEARRIKPFVEWKQTLAAGRFEGLCRAKCFAEAAWIEDDPDSYARLAHTADDLPEEEGEDREWP